jgi:hypothetical protein
VLKNAPGPSPWYLKWDPPNVNEFPFKDAEDDPAKTGKMLLLNPDGKVIAVINMYAYTLALDDRFMLFWRQKYANEPSDSIEFELVDLMSLPEISDLQNAYELMGDYRTDQYLFHLGHAGERFKVSTNSPVEKQSYDFPKSMSNLEELLVLASLTGEAATAYEHGSTTSIFALRPISNTIEIFPQDWFNTGDLDYGYQWITRVARDTISGKIYGEGFRISSFVLDDSSRNIEKSFDHLPS